MNTLILGGGLGLGEDKALARAGEWVTKAGVIPSENVERIRSQAEKANDTETLRDEIERVLIKKGLGRDL